MSLSRRSDEKLDQYRNRLSREKAQVKQHLKGRLFFSSSGGNTYNVGGSRRKKEMGGKKRKFIPRVN